MSDVVIAGCWFEQASVMTCKENQQPHGGVREGGACDLKSRNELD